METPLSVATVVLPHRAVAKATTTSAPSASMKGVAVSSCPRKIAQTRASDQPGSHRAMPTAVAVPSTTSTSSSLES